MDIKKPRIPIQAIVFAEGGSLRLRPLTEHLPTSLVPVGGTPILDHQLQVLLRLNLRSLTVVGGYRAVQVEQACRHYEGVLFRVNPRFSRGEPQKHSLLAAAPEAGLPALLVRGDLVFDQGIVQALLDLEAPDGQVVGPTGKGIGLCRASADTLRELVQSAGGPAKGDPDLFPWVESVLASRSALGLPVGNHPWARVSSLEDLARALKAGRDSQASRVAEAERSLSTAPGQTAPAAGAPADGASAPPQAASADGDSALGAASTLLTRSLLRVFPR